MILKTSLLVPYDKPCRPRADCPAVWRWASRLDGGNDHGNGAPRRRPHRDHSTIAAGPFDSPRMRSASGTHWPWRRSTPSRKSATTPSSVRPSTISSASSMKTGCRTGRGLAHEADRPRYRHPGAGDDSSSSAPAALVVPALGARPLLAAGIRHDRPRLRRTTSSLDASGSGPVRRRASAGSTRSERHSNSTTLPEPEARRRSTSATLFAKRMRTGQPTRRPSTAMRSSPQTILLPWGDVVTMTNNAGIFRDSGNTHGRGSRSLLDRLPEPIEQVVFFQGRQGFVSR